MYTDKIVTAIHCMDNYSVNWAGEDNKRGVLNAIKLDGNFGYTEFTGLVSTAHGIVIQHGSAMNHLSNAYKQLGIKKVEMVDTMRRFYYLVRGPSEALDVGMILPSVPSVSSSQLIFSQRTALFKEYWSLLPSLATAGLPDPLVLEGGIGLEEFTTMVEALDLAYMAVIQLKRETMTLRNTRENLIKKQIKGRIMEYRERIFASYGKDSTISKELPLIRPLPGPTPDKVAVQASWDEIQQKAVLSWTPSVRPEIVHYEIRGCHEGPYSVEREFTLATVPKTQLTWASAEGLDSEGSTMLYRVYVVTNTHRERGSKSATVVRPEVMQAAA